jgi:pyrroloquinoline quinone biosynthesis protein D
MPSIAPMWTEAAGVAMSPSNPSPPSSKRPALSPHVQLTFDRVRQQHVLLAPESVTVLNATGAAVLRLCDGQSTVDDIVRELRGRYDHVAADDVRDFITRLVARGYVGLADG